MFSAVVFALVDGDGVASRTLAVGFRSAGFRRGFTGFGVASRVNFGHLKPVGGRRFGGEMVADGIQAPKRSGCFLTLAPLPVAPKGPGLGFSRA